MSTTDSSDTDASWVALKAAGTTAFKARKWGEARALYERALAALGQRSEGELQADLAATSNAAAAAPAAAATTTPLRAAQACLLHSNLSATLFQLGEFAQALLEADRAIEADPSFMKARLRRALALEALATAPASTATTGASGGGAPASDEHRRAMQLQEAITICTKLAVILKSPAGAGGTSAPAGLPSAAEVNSTLVRLRTALTTLQARAASPMPYLHTLRACIASAAPSEAASTADTASSAATSVSGATVRSAIRSLMRLVGSSAASKAEALGEGMLTCLINIALPSSDLPQQKQPGLRTRAAAARALRHLLSSDMATNGAASSSSISMDLKPVRNCVPALLSSFASLREAQAAQMRAVPPPLPSAITALDLALSALAGLMSRVAAHPRLEHAYTAQICNALAAALPRYATHSPTAIEAFMHGGTSGSKGASAIKLAAAAVEALTFVTASPLLPAPVAKEIRTEWLPLLLLEPVAELVHGGGGSDSASAASAAQLRGALLAAVSVLTRHAFPSGPSAAAAAASAAASSMMSSLAPQLAAAFGGRKGGDEDLSPEEAKAREEDGINVREQSLRMLYAPLMEVVEPVGPSSSSSPSSSQARLHFVKATRLLRGLSLLLQANSVLGNFVVSFGAQKQQQQAAPAPPANNAEEEEMKRAADTAPPSVPRPSAATAPPANEELTPTVLHLLLTLSSFVSQQHNAVGGAAGAPPKVLQLLSAEVLALASSDALIRQTLVQLSRPRVAQTPEEKAEEEELRREGVSLPEDQGRGADVFLDLLVQHADLEELEADPRAPGKEKEKKKKAPSAAAGQKKQRDLDAPIPNDTIVAHACLALSKLAAVGEWGSVSPSSTSSDSATAVDAADAPDAEGTPEFALVLHILCRLLEKHRHALPRVKKDADKEARLAEAKAQREKQRAERKARAGGQEDDDDDDDDEDDDLLLPSSSSSSSSGTGSSLSSESARLQSVSLLHLALEALSYATLHVFAKKHLMADDEGYNIKLLVSIAAGTPGPSTGAQQTHAQQLGVISDSTVRYALLHIFRNLCTSRASLASSHNAELEQLKAMASRGLSGAGGGPNSAAAINEQQNKRQQALAGSETMIQLVMRALANIKAVAALGQLHRGYVIQQQEIDANSHATAGGVAKSASASSGAASAARPALLTPALANAFAFALLQLSSVPENRGLVVQQGGVRLLLDLYGAATKPGDALPPGVQEPSAEEGSGHSAPNSPYRCALDCLTALARLFIRVNPTLVPAPQLRSVARVLLEGLAGAEHELLTFEALMALTNLASFRSSATEDEDSLAEFIAAGAGGAGASPVRPSRGAPSTASPSSAPQLSGWSLAKSCLASGNVLVQRAAVELLTNLVNCPWVRRKLRAVPAELRAHEAGTVAKLTQAEWDASYAAEMAEPGRVQSEDLRLLLAFSLSEDGATASAASGALAMLSAEPLLAARIAATTVVSYVPLGEAEPRQQQSGEVDPATAAELLRQHADHAVPEGKRAVVRTGQSIAQKLLRDPATSQDVRVRVQALQQNFDELKRASK